ncbi:uncharacterized protein LOC122370818 [Amphibalanus amphitrite]|uniref:uncharacterized protein LOC122370818 n=1 Tax=Amphibalanus amphitrite TaxID=1232801 RepID=UPI001C8FDD7C|nr:uncharacterized protein LOC122370818 [Amphibalanus amphitrite]
MPYQLPSLEHECITSLLLHSNYVKAALQQVVSVELRAQITRRVIMSGKVTAVRVALNTWPKKTLALGDLCCRERLLSDHALSMEVENVLPQLLSVSMGRPSFSPRPGQLGGSPLSVGFISARFLEMTLSDRPGQLRHLDMTYYGMVTLPELEPILDALFEINRTDAEEGCHIKEPFSLSVGLAVSADHETRELEAATVKLDWFLKKQSQRRVRCQLRITGLFSGEEELQKRARSLLRLLVRRSCPIEVLITNGSSDWGRGEQASLVERLNNLRLVGSGACDARIPMQPRPRPQPPAPLPVVAVVPDEPEEMRRQERVYGLVLSGCRRGVPRRIKEACEPSGPLRSLSVSRSLLSLFAASELHQLQRLTIVHGHGSALERPHEMDAFLDYLPQLRELQVLSIYEAVSKCQLRKLAAALPELPELRFCRVLAVSINPIGALAALGIGARQAPMLKMVHVKLDRKPTSDETLSLKTLTEVLSHRLGEPRRDNVGFYLTEGSYNPNDVEFIPL